MNKKGKEEFRVKEVLHILTKKQATTMLGRLGERWDNFQLLIATILSARSKDEVTEVLAEKLLKKYPTAMLLANANPSDVKRMIHRIGFFNDKTKHIQETSRMLLSNYGGAVPSSFEELMQLPGVGRKVAGCVLVYGFGKDAIPVDIHVHRISNRLGWVRTRYPEQTEQELMKLIPKHLWKTVNDTLVAHGKTICTPINPFCSKCPVQIFCKKVGVIKSR